MSYLSCISQCSQPPSGMLEEINGVLLVNIKRAIAGTFLPSSVASSSALREQFLHLWIPTYCIFMTCSWNFLLTAEWHIDTCALYLTGFSFVKMNEAPITFPALKKNFEANHTRKKDIRNECSSKVLPVTKKEIKHHKHYKKHKTTAGDITSKADSSHLPWQLISSVLGVQFLLLMAGTIIAAVFTASSSPKATFPTIQQEGMVHLCLGPGHQPCPKDWVWFRCSCYYFSTEKLAWNNSLRACSSLNASLVKINREETNFFSLKSFFWTGIYYKKIENQWYWENNSVLPQDT
ncbi:killer cell lectin-like receptor subfamily E member 1 [Fukomys damarensis]|uniref:killer cell lectin-like receptor subfamily E member 1 n=1 Tax=Fukomys damarensis TaxID=885580 RepID=UPI0008FF4BD5|nr:killer cell lectin-like receptor subfamily E member 1 [Fukomys damarensis]